jgi:predicted DCC family thiol-disulfide oxidoreductase YuxK
MHAPARADARWTVFYDADCGLCTWLLAAVLRADRSRRLRPVALQDPEAAEVLAALTPEVRMSSWHLVSPASRRWSGGAAVAPMLRQLPHGSLPAAGLERFPACVERSYRWVSEHRGLLGRFVPASAKRRAKARVFEAR